MFSCSIVILFVEVLVCSVVRVVYSCSELVGVGLELLGAVNSRSELLRAVQSCSELFRVGQSCPKLLVCVIVVKLLTCSSIVELFNFFFSSIVLLLNCLH